jgi:uncharacterized DUF497 family protein
MELTSEWDEEKAKASLRKHKVSFEEAKTASSIAAQENDEVSNGQR